MAKVIDARDRFGSEWWTCQMECLCCGYGREKGDAWVSVKEVPKRSTKDQYVECPKCSFMNPMPPPDSDDQIQSP